MPQQINYVQRAVESEFGSFDIRAQQAMHRAR
jgi:hypothetical protein